MIAFRSSWFIVTLTDELMGKLYFLSRLPQYLMTAIFEGAENPVVIVDSVDAAIVMQSTDAVLRLHSGVLLSRCHLYSISAYIRLHYIHDT